MIDTARTVHTSTAKAIAKNNVDAYIFVTSFDDTEQERIFATTSIAGNEIQVLSMLTKLFLTICENANEENMSKVVTDAKDDALKIYEESKNERNRKDIM